MQKSQCERKYFAMLSSTFKRGTFENELCLVKTGRQTAKKNYSEEYKRHTKLEAITHVI